MQQTLPRPVQPCWTHAQACRRQGRTGQPIFCRAATQTSTIRETAGYSLQGSSRKQNEDRWDLQVSDDTGKEGDIMSYVGVFDGHGGNAVAQWLEDNMQGYVEEAWQGGSAPESAVTDAFLEADKRLLAPKKGLFGGMGERGIGGSKCGATGVVALMYVGKGGKPTLLSANVGDSRALLLRGGEAIQLSDDHVPDQEEERLRIEAQNPNPKQPLGVELKTLRSGVTWQMADDKHGQRSPYNKEEGVPYPPPHPLDADPVRYVGGTWRVGGILALSRAFGDAYLKGSLQFEGVRAGSDGYSSGFGVISQPTVATAELSDEDTWLLVATDGLFANEERGGGGGLSNDEVGAYVHSKAGRLSAEDIAELLVAEAQRRGSTDDITVVLIRLK